MMLTDEEVMTIKIGEFIEAVVVGDKITAKYNFYHDKIKDGIIMIDIPVNKILWSDIRFYNIKVSLDKTSGFFKVSNDKKATIKGSILDDCTFSLRYRMKTIEKEMTLAEIEKALGHRVKIVTQ